MSVTTEEAERLAYRIEYLPSVASAFCSLAAERDALQAENARIKELLKEVGSLAASRAGRVDVLEAENARLRKLVSYLAGTNTDHVQVALAGNPIVCDAIHAEACALLGETQ